MMNQRNRTTHFGASILMVIGMTMTLTSWIATQYLGIVLHYQPNMGEAVAAIGRHKLYQPFQWFVWNLDWMHVEGRLQDYLTHVHVMMVIGGLVSLIFAIVMAYRRSLQRETTDDLHGTANWAAVADIRKMGMIAYDKVEGRWPMVRRQAFRPQGVHVGAFEVDGIRKVLRYNDPAHILGYMPSRSGKGVGLVVPTLLSYPHSTVTNDIKGENYELTSGFRHTAGSLVLRLDPTGVDQKSIDGRTRYNASVQWNVLDEIRIFSEYDVMDAQNIAACLADPKGEGMDDHWVSTSYELFTGVILHVLYFERDKSLPGVAQYLADPSFSDPEQMYSRMLEAEHDPEMKMGWVDSNGKATSTHPVVAMAARSMLNKEEKERNSVLSTAKTKLALYAEPIVARNIARSDFRMRDIMNHDKPVSAYLVIPPSDKERLRPYVRLFLGYLIRCLTKSMKFEEGASAKEYLHRLLLLVDEAASLKKLEELQDGLSYMAGYGITAFILVQDVIQLQEAYGDKETMSAGCQLKIASAPNTLQTAEQLSSMTGVTTRKRQNVSYSGSRMSTMLNQMSVSEELVERPLMTADEIMRLPRDECLIFNAGHSPVHAKKLQYFKMPEFLKRAKIASPSRVALMYRDETGQVKSNWFMVLCERGRRGETGFSLSVNCYDTFPLVRVLVKQQDVETDVVREFEFELCDESGNAITRGLTTDDLHFSAKAKGSLEGFDPSEAWEVHFPVREAGKFDEYSQKGFYRDISVYERETRKLVRDHFHEHEERTGQKLEPSIATAAPDNKYSGSVLLETDKFVALLKGADIVSLHRKSKLTRIPTGADTVTIQYSGKEGEVL